MTIFFFKLKVASVGGKTGTYILLLGIQNGAVTVENNMEVP